MQTKTKGVTKEISLVNKVIYAGLGLLLILLMFNDLLVNKLKLNLRIILELFLLPYLVLKINFGVNLSRNNYRKSKLALNFLWGVISLVLGILGLLELILSVSILEIHGNIVTVLSFSIGIFLLLSNARHLYFDKDFAYYKQIYQYFSYVLAGFSLALLAMILLANLLEVNKIHFGNSTSGIFILDIFATSAFLLMLAFLLHDLWREHPIIENFTFLKDDVPFWFVLMLVAILFLELFIFQLMFSNLSVGRDLFQDSIKNSLFTGSIYILLGIGLSMAYKILNFANFANGELVIFGSYGSIISLEGVHYGFIPDIVLFILVSFIASGILALIGDFFVFRPLRNRNAEPFTFMIASIGLSIIVRFMISSVFGVDSRGVIIENSPLLNVVKYMIILLAVIFVVLLELLLRKTKIGKAMRAMSDNPKLAQVTGISPTMVIILVWIIGAGFAGVGGLFKLLANATLIPSFGFTLLLPTFAVVILGGIGSYKGAIIAGYIIGFAENFGTFIMIFFRQIKEQFILQIPILMGDMTVRNFNIEPTFSQQYQFAFGFIILILVLLVKPTGIMGEAVVRER